MPNMFFKGEKTIKKYILITILILMFFTLVIIFYEYEEYVECYGELNNDELMILVEKDEISKISNVLLIDNKLENCKINRISKDYIMNTDYKLYHEVYYKCDLKNLNDNYIFNIKISKGKTTFLEKIKKIF